MSKVIVISSDAMVGEDLEYFKTLSSYKNYFAGGAEITNVSSIYPSVTFPAHATMMTGMYPSGRAAFCTAPTSSAPPKRRARPPLPSSGR